MKIRDLFKRKKENNTNDQSNITQEFEIQIQGDVNLFKDEKEKILQGAKQLLEIEKADDMQDAIISIGVMFRGLKFSDVQKTKDGKTIIVFSEVGEKKSNNEREKLVGQLSNNGEYLNVERTSSAKYSGNKSGENEIFR